MIRRSHFESCPAHDLAPDSVPFTGRDERCEAEASL